MVAWLKAESIEIDSAEESISHKWGYCGRPDCLAVWRGKDVWIDFKFSQSISEQNQIQGVAYTKLTGRPGLFLQCPKDGKVKATRCKPDPTLWAVFLSGLQVLHFQQARRPQQLTPEQIEQLTNQFKEIFTCQTN